MSGDGVPVDAARDAVTASVEAAYHVLSAKHNEIVEIQKRECAEEVEQVRKDAAEAAAKVKDAATAEAAVIATEAAEILRAATAKGEALDAEKAAMEKTYEFQTKKTLLNVGGVRFETSLPTLTSVPDTYLEVFFSGRHPLAPDPTDGSFFIDRSGAHFEHIINYLRDPG